uniref:NADH dehydrogenase subunit 4L n=1 Tax=Megalophaedusa toshiyukii TaxID=1885776 RepID=A0A224A9I2_9EUPU|nr:NADH dehydrogenase subunit 4L [Megalophaedusa toshiyukii]
MVFKSCLVLMVAGLLFSLLKVRKHYLSALLTLEAMVITALVFSLFLASEGGSHSWILLLLLGVVVCGAGLGLAVLISYIKHSGNDLISG